MAREKQEDGMELHRWVFLASSLSMSACGSSDIRATVVGADAAASTDVTAPPGLDAGSSTDSAANDADVPDVVGLGHPLACSDLGAKGTWQEITPSRLRAFHSTAQLLVDPVTSGTVYLGTCAADGHNSAPGAGIFRSTDCGTSWIQINTGRNGTDLTNGCQWSEAIDPTDPQTIYFNAGYGTSALYKSTNGGVDWDVVWPPPNDQDASAESTGFVGALAMDPYDPKHLLLSFHTNCGNASPAVGCFAETLDGGATWRVIFNTVTPFEPQVRAYFLDKSTTWLAASNQTLLRSEDSGNTWTSVASGVAFNVHSAGEILRARNGIFYYDFTYGILRSPDGVTWTQVDESGQWLAGMVDTGTTLYSSGVGLLASPNTDGTTWTEVPNFTSPNPSGGAGLGYDPDHHVLYAVELSQGIFRMVTD
jgi:hypothetical protein